MMANNSVVVDVLQVGCPLRQLIRVCLRKVHSIVVVLNYIVIVIYHPDTQVQKVDGFLMQSSG